MYITGIILLVVGVAGCIYGYSLNNSLEAQLSSLFEYGYSDPGTIFIIIGAVCAVLGVVFIIAGLTKKKDTTEYVLVCSACGADNVSTDKDCKKCRDCKGNLVYSGFTKTEWFSLEKDERMIIRDRIVKKEQPKTKSASSSKPCSECGREISVNAKFCPYCGHVSSNAASEEKPAKEKEEPRKYPCPHCKKEIVETATFCPYCGKDPKHHTEPEPVPHADDIVEERGTRYCPHCGKLISETVAFCPHCNKDVRREIKKPQLIVNLPKEKPAPETPPVEKKADAAFELAVVEETPTPQENVIEDLPEQPKEEPVVEEIPAPQEPETEELPEQPREVVYQPKHLKPSETPEEPKEEVVKVTEAEVIHVVTIPEKESTPEPSMKEEPVPAPRNKGFAPPEDLD